MDEAVELSLARTKFKAAYRQYMLGCASPKYRSHFANRDIALVEEAWDEFLKLRKLYEGF